MNGKNSSNSNNNNNNETAARGKDTGLSPVRKTRRKAPPMPPPEIKREVAWGDRKPAAKITAKPTNYAYNYNNHCPLDLVVSPDDFEDRSNNNNNNNNTKDGILFPRNSPPRKKGVPGNNKNTDGGESSNGSESKNSQPSKQSSDDDNNRMSRRELFWTSFVFVAIVVIAVTTTVVVMNKENRGGNNNNNNIQKNSSSKSNQQNGNGDGMDPNPASIPPNTPPSTTGGHGGVTGTVPTTQPRKISVREEWELVHAAIRNNNATRVLLEAIGGMKEPLPLDLYFYDHLVSGMVFSEQKRDWIPSPARYDTDDDTIGIEGMGMGGMSMGDTQFGNDSKSNNDGSGSSSNRGNTSKTLTPNQKATAWLLFHDERKDPSESVWRWAMASIYFKMGGDRWTFHNAETSGNKWLTSAPLCEWEILYGSSGCENRKYKQPTGVPLLPVELDFDNTNLAGAIAIEFALLVQPEVSSSDTESVNTNDNVDVTAAATSSATTTNKIVRSIMLSDNRLTGTIPGTIFQHLMPSLGKLYLDNNQLTGTVPLELGGLDTLYVQNNALTGDWSQSFCKAGDKTIESFGLDCDKIECSPSCCGFLQCYYSKLL